MERNTSAFKLATGTRCNQRIDSGNSSNNQVHSNSSNISGPEREDDYAALVEAVRSGNWNATRDYLKDHPAALTARILTTGGTVLHAAVEAEQEHIAEELVNMISEQDSYLLTMKDYSGSTALHETAINGNQRMAECLITKNMSLLSIRDNQNELPLPVALAMDCGHTELARYLYSQTPFQVLEAEEGCQGASLLNRCIYNRDLDMALVLMERCPRLALVLDHLSNMSPLEVLAYNSTDAFESRKEGEFWAEWIKYNCIHISSLDLERAADQFRLNIPNHGQENNIGSVRADLWRQLASSLLNLLGLKRLYEMKFLRVRFQQLLSRMSQAIPKNRYDIIAPAMFGAIRRGNFEFVYHIVRANPEILSISDVTDGEGKGIFHCAILHRQYRIFSFIYSLKKKHALLNGIDTSKNTILHMAGMLTEHTPINHIRGAGLQMQREVQWFKEVERICPRYLKENLNNDGLTARELFTRDHQKMRKDGEQWMKDTATSCTVIGALIITIMFAGAFTIPGGNNQVTGLPIFMHDKLFILFIVSDSLSLFFSSTSVLVFLGIHTSRYAEEDFFKSLPRMMIIGLSTLLFSIATMMIAFSAVLILMLREKYRIFIPVICLGGYPIFLFVMMQFQLLSYLCNSTYGEGIFDWKRKL